MLRSPASHIEALESRIAPAVYFVSGAAGANAFKIFTAAGADAQDTAAENSAAMATHADAVVLLGAGDSLVFDPEGDHLMGAKDTLIARVTTGSAMFFFKNLVGGKTKAFEPTELTGLAYGDGFSGEIFSGVRGSVVAALDTGGQFVANGLDLPLQKASLAGLRSAGQIAGSIVAGGGISDVYVGQKTFFKGEAKLSVTGTIATGTAAAGIAVSFDGGTTVFTTGYVASAGEAGPTIRNVRLVSGAPKVAAGDGGDIASGNGGNGGAIEDVNLGTFSVPVRVIAGNGGASTGLGDAGGGGSILALSFEMVGKVLAESIVQAGSGGSAATGQGGAGGALDRVTLTLGDTGDFTIKAGAGGDVSGVGDGGAGGYASGVFVTAGAVRVALIEGGAGGDGGLTSGNAGDGGAVTRSSFSAGGKTQSLQFGFQAGSGGQVYNASNTSGAGGGVSDVSLVVNGPVITPLVAGGSSGSGNAGTTAKGGDISLVRAQVYGMVTGNLTMEAGSGGVANGGPGGDGGRVANVDIFAKSKRLKSVKIISGSGSSQIGMTGAPGAAGDVSDIRFENRGAVGEFSITGGYGGNFSGTSNGGAGGDVSYVSIVNRGKLGKPSVVGGGGGAAGDGTGSGAQNAVGNSGDSGNVDRVDFTDYFGTTDPFNVYSAPPKLLGTAGGSGSGGSLGNITNITLNAPKTSVLIGGEFTASDGGSGAMAMGGFGGAISDISGSVGELSIIAPGGGSAANGTGGQGGSIADVHIGQITKFARIIAAGDGGAGATPADCGFGGSISNVFVTGDIGDFRSAFGVDANAVAMGGLIAGGSANGAKNGTITGVAAERIAAILAGRPAAGALGYGNAVSTLQNIYANVIGADTKRKGSAFEVTASGLKFDFKKGTTDTIFSPDNLGTATDGDIPIDGFVLVKSAGLGFLSVAPLKLIAIA